jgi:L-ribulose-5-phosphate 3-epimerase
MYKFPIGVLAESFKTSLDDALSIAENIGLKGVQIYATKGEVSPENLSKEKRKEILSKVKSHGLVISALCGDLGCGFTDPEKNPSLVDKSKRILELAKELETDIVTTHIGVVPEDKNNKRFQIMFEACRSLAEFAESMDAHFAVETGPERAKTLKAFLDTLDSKGVAVNYDPANLAMVTGDDPVEGVYTLKDYIVHTHAKDGKKLKDSDPEVIYGMKESDMLADASFIELPLGTGSVDFKQYLKALDEIGYKGFLTIEREVGGNPKNDIILAKNYLESIM